MWSKFQQLRKRSQIVEVRDDHRQTDRQTDTHTHLHTHTQTVIVLGQHIQSFHEMTEYKYRMAKKM